MGWETLYWHFSSLLTRLHGHEVVPPPRREGPPRAPRLAAAHEEVEVAAAQSEPVGHGVVGVGRLSAGVVREEDVVDDAAVAPGRPVGLVVGHANACCDCKSGFCVNSVVLRSPAVSSLVVHKRFWSSNYVSLLHFYTKKRNWKRNWSSRNVCG